MHPVSRRCVGVLLAAVAAFLVTYFDSMRTASAVPSFSRKYQTSCLTCHTVYPQLNPFGQAFRRNGYRFPSQKGSVDSDAAKTPLIPLGQEEYKRTFPDSVWPSQIPDSVPLSIMLNGGVNLNIPGSDAHDAAGNTFDWGGIVGEIHIFGAGSFSDTVTYFTQITLESDFGDPPATFDVETGYLLWNDIVGPAHAVNLWVGRLMGPQLNSFGTHSSYLSDTFFPGVSVVGLMNPTGSFAVGSGHTDGVELNGILGHRFDYSLGWTASSTASGIQAPNAENAYAHIGIKSGGVALDGEGKYGPNVPDPAKPWAEKSITIDAFAYHGLNVLDNGTGTISGGAPAPIAQRDRWNAVGGSIVGQLDSAILTLGGQVEQHASPYQGTAANPGGTTGTIPGVPTYQGATGVVGWAELNYVVWPWFVPGVRAEFTQTSGSTLSTNNSANLLRVIPGVSMLVRPNIRVILTGDFERAQGTPVAGDWGNAGGVAMAPPPVGTQQQSTKLDAEVVSAVFNVAF